MRTPPYLLGAALLFWGWQAGYLIMAAIMAALLEGARFSNSRWDLSDEDFSRIWTLCSILFLGASVYAFTSNEGPGRLGRMLQNPTFSNQSSAGVAGARTAIALFRWLPMMFFPFVTAQAYSTREAIPWSTISQISRWRWKRAVKSGKTPQHHERGVNVGFPYFGLCLFAASAHPGESSGYFFGVAMLLAWALWRQRTRRFGIVLWIVMVGLVTGFGYAGQRSIGKLQNYLTNLNPEMFSSFFRHRSDPTRSQTAIGQIGRIKQSGRIVIRLKPLSGSVPIYLREASYRSFRSPFWMETVPRQNFESVAQETNGTTWILLPEKTNTARLEISCYLDDISPDTRNPTRLLPVPEGVGRLENLPVYLLRKNGVGSLLAEGPGLVIFQACYGPGAQIDSPPNTNIEWSAHSRRMEDSAYLDLNVPAKEERGLDAAISEMNIRGDSNEEKMQAVYAFFQNKFKYSSWLQSSRHGGTNETPLAQFLLETRSGHCEYFASATVLLLRRLHIPARYTVGFAVHEASGDEYVVRERDAHAWCRVWNDAAQQWRDFDTTPASWVDEESKHASPWQRVSDIESWLWFQFSKFRWGQSHLRKYFLYMLAPVLAMLSYQIFVRWKRTRNKRKAQGAGGPRSCPGNDSEFYQVERRLAHRGIVREPGEPVSAWLRRATRQPEFSGVRDPLQSLLRLHYRYRFDPRSLDAADRVELRQGSARVLKEMESRGG